MAVERWPPLPYEAWRDTYATLHLWTQVVGKVALAAAPALNHSWAIAMSITPRGLATRTLPHPGGPFAIEFDLVDHQLLLRPSEGPVRTLPLVPRTVAEFHDRVMALLREMNRPVTIWPVAVELPAPIRLDRDTEHASYDPAQANRFLHVLLEVERVLTACRCGFLGKASPVHFFWGAFDVAVTRFSGKEAPPREGPEFMREAYSHEVISHGFWPGSGPVQEPAFYAYAVPEPAGFKQARVRPDAAFYHQELGEFILPYEAVRTAPSPDDALADFVQTTYARAADLAGWDRAALERSS
jgi:uncharacterized protein DUF5996